MSDVELTPVRPAHVFDKAALEAYMRTKLDGYRPPMKVQQFEGGQSNPTFMLETPTERYVLRKQPPGELLPSAHQIDREYRVMDALHGTGVPVPKMYSLCEDPKIIGTKFYIMEMVEGRLFTKTTLPELTPADRREIYLDMARVLAALHRVDPTVVGLDDFRRPGNYFARQVNRWTKQYLASETENIDAMNRLIDWLPKNIPAESSTGIVHGDFRLGNLLLHETQPKIVAILDWELWSVGDVLHPRRPPHRQLPARPCSHPGHGARRSRLPVSGVPLFSERNGGHAPRCGSRKARNPDGRGAYPNLPPCGGTRADRQLDFLYRLQHVSIRRHHSRRLQTRP